MAAAGRSGLLGAVGAVEAARGQGFFASTVIERGMRVPA